MQMFPSSQRAVNQGCVRVVLQLPGNPRAHASRLDGRGGRREGTIGLDGASVAAWNCLPPPYLSSRTRQLKPAGGHLRVRRRYSWRVKTELVMVARRQEVHFTRDRDISTHERSWAPTRSRSLVNGPSSVR